MDIFFSTVIDSLHCCEEDIRRHGAERLFWSKSAKKADSDDLLHGFDHQLSNYMQRIGTDYGIYLVYWLKSADYPFPKGYDIYASLEIDKLHPIPRRATVRTLGMNLSRELPPSMKQMS